MAAVALKKIYDLVCHVFAMQRIRNHMELNSLSPAESRSALRSSKRSPVASTPRLKKKYRSTTCDTFTPRLKFNNDQLCFQ